jgi:hypothetical protein
MPPYFMKWATNEQELGLRVYTASGDSRRIGGGESLRRIHRCGSLGDASSQAKLNVIDQDIELDGSLAEDQRARLLAVANRCPVHLTLTSRIDIRTRLQ